MIKEKLIERLEWYYPTERFNAYYVFPIIMVLVLVFNDVQNVLFLNYGLLVCIFILIQGQHYWKLKLWRLKDIEFDQQQNLSHFRKAKAINWLLIWSMPLVLFFQLYIQNWSAPSRSIFYWSLFTNAFAILEHINYYYYQVSIDNRNDWQYVFRNRRLKRASLAKDLLKGRI